MNPVWLGSITFIIAFANVEIAVYISHLKEGGTGAVHAGVDSVKGVATSRGVIARIAGNRGGVGLDDLVGRLPDNRRKDNLYFFQYPS